MLKFFAAYFSSWNNSYKLVIFPSRVMMNTRRNTRSKDVITQELPSEAQKKRKKNVKVSYDDDTAEKVESEYFNNTTSQWTPENWEVMLDNIRKMRNDFDAPVDTMGCEQCVNQQDSSKVWR